MSDYKCVWPIGKETGDDCKGPVQEVCLFAGILNIPICQYHLEWHKEIVALYESGMIIDDIVSLKRQECREKFAALENKGGSNV
jgi:hypothetical protein